MIRYFRRNKKIITIVIGILIFYFLYSLSFSGSQTINKNTKYNNGGGYKEEVVSRVTKPPSGRKIIKKNTSTGPTISTGPSSTGQKPLDYKPPKTGDFKDSKSTLLPTPTPTPTPTIKTSTPLVEIKDQQQQNKQHGLQIDDSTIIPFDNEDKEGSGFDDDLHNMQGGFQEESDSTESKYDFKQNHESPSPKVEEKKEEISIINSSIDIDDDKEEILIVDTSSLESESIELEDQQQKEKEESELIPEKENGDDDDGSEMKKKFDVGISVLGYRLHDDGMPTKILKDRVNLAIEHYKDLKSQGYSPVILLSGKGKDTTDHEPAFTSESDAMASLLMSGEVSSQDIHLDRDSTNTAENAKNTLALFLENNINRLIVVTSDFHVLRTQYTFQTVFPANIDIEFYGAPTSAAVKKEVAGAERSLFSSSQNDLTKLGILNNTGSFGYHPIRNLPRWRMIEREIEYDQNHYREIENGSLIVDYGSNEGYFSLSVSQKLPMATVFSLEGEAISEYKSAASHHEDKMKELNVTNNFLCKTTVLSDMFRQLREQHHSYEYQLCLSVFHWFGMKTQEEFEEVLYNHLMASKTTFLELPEAMKYTGREGQHAWKSTNIWYNGRSEVEILADLKAKYNMKMTWKILGALVHDNNTVRKVIRVDVRDIDEIESRSPLSIEKLKEIYQCGKLMHP